MWVTKLHVRMASSGLSALVRGTALCRGTVLWRCSHNHLLKNFLAALKGGGDTLLCSVQSSYTFRLTHVAARILLWDLPLCRFKDS